MKITAAVAVLLLSGLASTFSAVINAEDRQVPPREIECSVDCMKGRALAGDMSAARNLALIYGKIDFKAMQYWNLIGAENGDPISQYNYAFWLLEKGAKGQKERAIFWLKKSAESGDKDAKSLLSKTEKPHRP